MIGGLAIVAGYAFEQGDPQKVYYPMDSQVRFWNGIWNEDKKRIKRIKKRGEKRKKAFLSTYSHCYVGQSLRQEQYRQGVQVDRAHPEEGSEEQHLFALP